MESKVSIPCAQKPATCRHFGPGKHNPQPQRISASNQHLGFQSGIFPSCFPTKILYAFLFSFIPHTLPVSQQFRPLVRYITCEKLKIQICKSTDIKCPVRSVSHTQFSIKKSFHVWKEMSVERQKKLKIKMMTNNVLTSPFWCNGHLQSTIHTGYCQHNSHK